MLECNRAHVSSHFFRHRCVKSLIEREILNSAGRPTVASPSCYGDSLSPWELQRDTWVKPRAPRATDFRPLYNRPPDADLGQQDPGSRWFLRCCIYASEADENSLLVFVQCRDISYCSDDIVSFISWRVFITYCLTLPLVLHLHWHPHLILITVYTRSIYIYCIYGESEKTGTNTNFTISQSARCLLQHRF